MKSAIEALTKISNAMWVVVPLPVGIDAVYAASTIDVVRLKEFVLLCDEHTDKLVKSSSAVRGILMASVVEPNIHTFITMFRDREKIEEVLNKK